MVACALEARGADPFTTELALLVTAALSPVFTSFLSAAKPPSLEDARGVGECVGLSAARLLCSVSSGGTFRFAAPDVAAAELVALAGGRDGPAVRVDCEWPKKQ